MDVEDMLECVDASSVFMLLSLLLLLAGAWVVQRFAKRFEITIAGLSATVATCGLTGRAVARKLLDACGLPQVAVEESSARDLYDPKHRKVQLTPQNYQGATISAVAIAAHEVGHAQQHASGSLVFRVAPLVRCFCWVSLVACLLLVVGIVALPLYLVNFGVVGICVVSLALQTAVVLPREIDASRRAKVLAQQAGLLTTADELKVFDRVLHSAGWTYVASMSFRWLGVIAVAVALLCVGNAQSMLNQELELNHAEFTADAQLIEQVATMEGLAAEPTPPANHDRLPWETPAELETSTSWAGRQLDAADVALPAPYSIAYDQPPADLGYSLMMVLVSAVQWCGILGAVGVFLLLGRLQRKWTAPQQAVKRNQAGVRHFERGKYERAVRDFTKALKLDPKLSGGYCNRAAAYRQLNRSDEALADFEAALRLHPGLVTAKLGRAEILLPRGHRDEALAEIREVLRLAPECTAALGLRGTILLDTQDADAAARDFEQAIALGANDPLPYWGLGVVWIGREDYQRAIDDFNVALAQSPEFFPALRDRGLARHLSGDHAAAVADLDQAVRLAPTDALALNNRAACWQKLGEYARAQQDLHEAIRISPGLPNAYKNLAWLQSTCPDAEFRDGTQAVANATRALDLVEWKQLQWLSVLAAACAETGEFEAAVNWQQECLAAAASSEKPSLQAQLQAYQAGQPYRDMPASQDALPSHASCC